MKADPITDEQWEALYQEIRAVVGKCGGGNSIWTSKSIADVIMKCPGPAPTLSGYPNDLSRFISKILFQNNVEKRRSDSPIQWVIQ